MAVGFYCDLTSEERLRRISRLVNKGLHLYYQKTNGKMEEPEQTKKVIQNHKVESKHEIELEEHKEILDDKIITVNEIINILKISRTTFWRIRKQNQIPYTFIGKRLIRFKLSNILNAFNIK